MKPPFIWDPYSDQPYPIKDKTYKSSKRRENILASILTILIGIIIFPIALIIAPFLRGKQIDQSNFYGMGVDLDKGEQQVALIDELGVKHLLIRMPLWQMDRIEEYVQFVRSFGNDKEILINILQDREHIEDTELLTQDIGTIFKSFSPFVTEFQIGNAINRTKWGFFSMDEYLQWYQTVEQIRDQSFPDIKLIGSSTIDFEYHYTIRTLFNLYRLKYDRFSSLLYVDRRGSPSNKQLLIFDLKTKIDLLYSIVKLSPKTTNTIYITETNWPLSGTAPHAPTSEAECVNEHDYTTHMLQYHQTTLSTKKITRIYWHQLIAAGYGLMDDRDGELRKRDAFYAYRNMVRNP